jgi:hypothetical protein
MMLEMHKILLTKRRWLCFTILNHGCQLNLFQNLFQTRGKMRLPNVKRKSEKGQATVEYVVVAGMLLASLAVLTLLLVTFQEYGLRILEMVASDYP